MEVGTSEITETAILSAEQLVDLSLSPYHIDINLLHTLLHMIISKLNLQTARVQLSTPYAMPEINSMVSKTSDIFEIFNVVEGGARKPFKLGASKLEKVEPEVDLPVEKLYKILKIPSEGKDFRRVTFHRESQLTDDMVDESSDATDGVGFTFAELLNITKRLECCEIGIEKLTHLLHRVGSSYKDLERSFLEISSSDKIYRKSLEENRRVTIEHSSQTEQEINKALQKEAVPGPDQEARRDIKILQDTASTLIDQVESMFGKISDFKTMIESLQEENKQLKLALRQPADSEKLERCCKEICNMQKLMAQYADQTSNLISCTNKMDKRFKCINEQLAEMSKIRSHQQKIAELQDETKKINAQFDVYTERLDQVKLVKAEREELDFLFQCKADRDDLLQFVTLELFNAIRHDLSNGIVQAFNNIMETELKWKRSEQDLLLKLNDKLDIAEKLPLTHYINDRVACVQEQLNEIMCTRFDIKAAAVQKRALQNANCICCSSDADFVCDKPTLPKLQPLKHDKRICPEPFNMRKRYCGGSHTVLSSDQKMIQRRTTQLYTERTWESPVLVEGINGMMFRASEPTCVCGDEAFPKILYPRVSRGSKSIGEFDKIDEVGKEARASKDSKVSKASDISKASYGSRARVSKTSQGSKISKNSKVSNENKIIEEINGTNKNSGGEGDAL